ncbi:HK97-gp10 family putative phage morphogenesis protein [Companilactobacillus sp.]|uniref:HK97-gp10 family putative phage morphogenesis protein n=1 Tax=Companilactobacillus sp. TaxID=2767905 RepID=UPI002615ED1E|nr:HK97-gp10 family putative phage morphogenesis protein [Companilactobacillus sp.]
MANDFNIKWTGLNSLISEFNAAPKASLEATKSAIKSTLSKAQEVSKRNARVDTGYMRNNIDIDYIKASGSTVTGRYVARADYSSYNEYGTYKMSAKPFIRVGVAEARPYFVSEIKRELAKAANFS